MEYVGPPDDPHAHHDRTSLTLLFPLFVPEAGGATWYTRSQRLAGRLGKVGKIYMADLGRFFAGVDLDADGSHNYEEPKTFADFVRPEYR